MHERRCIIKMKKILCLHMSTKKSEEKINSSEKGNKVKIERQGKTASSNTPGTFNDDENESSVSSAGIGGKIRRFFFNHICRLLYIDNLTFFLPSIERKRIITQHATWKLADDMDQALLYFHKFSSLKCFETLCIYNFSFKAQQN